MSQLYKVISVFIILWTAYPLYAGDSKSLAPDLSHMELGLYEKINQARENPLAVAESLGMEPDRLLKELPDLHDMLMQGLLPLAFNEKLRTAARNHSLDMMEKQYYSHDSSDGRTYAERIAETGYIALTTGESLGLLAFDNFIKPDKAVELIFENLFKDELNPENNKKRMILNRDFQEMGIGFWSGGLKINGSFDNVYIVTCDFGTTAVSPLEREILELINKARENPLDMAISLETNPDKLLEEMEDISEILTKGLPPLTMNRSLYQAASGHAWDMIENGYFSKYSPKGQTLGDRIQAKGYEAVVSAEVMRILVTADFAEPAEAAQIHFESIFKSELSSDRDQQQNIILNPDLEDAGVSVVVTSPDTGENLISDTYSKYHVVLLVINAGTKGTKEKRIQKAKLQNCGDLAAVHEGYIEASKIREAEVEFLVDSKTEMLCLPPNLIEKLGLHLTHERKSISATGEVVHHRIFSPVHVIVSEDKEADTEADTDATEISAREANTDVMELPPDASPLMGYIPLKMLGIAKSEGSEQSGSSGQEATDSSQAVSSGQ